MYEKKSLSMKTVALLLAIVLLVGCVAGSTIAFLMTKSDDVVNTFVAGEIGELNLAETKGNEFTVIPGVDIEKDPTLTFENFNVDAYIFLTVDATGWTVSGSDTNYTYSIGAGEKEMKWTLEGWTELASGVYYKEVKAEDGDQSWSIIKDNTITVNAGITKDDIASYAKSLSFTAYAIQQATFDNAAAAWQVAQTATK